MFGSIRKYSPRNILAFIAKYINVFKPAAVREGITQAADNTMQKGIEFYEAVIKKVIDKVKTKEHAEQVLEILKTL